MHHDAGNGDVRHFEFLAVGDIDPRREVSETLLRALDQIVGPIIVYSSFEASVLRAVAAFLPDLSERLLAVVDRLCDLLPIIRSHVSHPEFFGSYSIKAIAPALGRVDEFSTAGVFGIERSRYHSGAVKGGGRVMA